MSYELPENVRRNFFAGFPDRDQRKADKHRARRQTKGRPLNVQEEQPKKLRNQFLMHTGIMTAIMFCFFTASASIVFNEYKGDSWTIHYWLEGDDSINGEHFSSANVGVWAGACAIGVLSFSLAVFVMRTMVHYNNMGKTWGTVANNLVVWGPLALANGFMAMVFTQLTGTSNLWSIVYVGVFSLISDWVGVSLRVLWVHGRRFGSGFLGLVGYFFMKSLPLIYLSLCATRNGLGTNITAAYWLYFSAVTLQLCWFLAVHLYAMSTADNGHAHVKLVLQSIDAYHNTLTLDAGGKDVRDHVSEQISRKAIKNVIRVLFAINAICVVLFAVGTTVGFSNSTRKTFERITWTLTKPQANAVTYNVEFDRVWGVLQVALPIQFGVLCLSLFYHMVAHRLFYSYMLNGSDVLNDMAFAVGDFFIVWSTLNFTGTSEFSDLLFGSFLSFACCILLMEARREYAWYFTLVPTVAFLLPLIHSCVNISLLANRSSQELVLPILIFAVLGLRQLIFFMMRYRGTNKEGWYYYDQNPHQYVLYRFIINWVVRWLVVAIWLSQAFHYGDEISNKK